MKNVRRFCVTIVGLLLLISCEDRGKDLSTKSDSTSFTQETSTNLDEKLTPVVLGEKMENPFSVENMQLALNSLLEKPDELEGAGVSKRNAEVIAITPTDWYICFKVDSTQFNTLTSDTTLSLTQIPLDYEIEQQGDYLEEFQNSEIKKLYTVVKPGYTNPNGIEFEILEELFIPENSEYYSEETFKDSENKTETRSTSIKLMDDNFVNALLIQSFVLTGNEKFLPERNKIEERMMDEECIPKRFLWWSWNDCNTYYYPEGKVSYQTPNGYEPVKGIKIVMWRWFTRIEAITNSDGYFISKTRLNKILIGNNVQYYMNMTGKNGNQTWHLDANLFGALCFWVNEYNLGSCSPNYVEFKFDSNHKAWRQCLVSNAVYDYITYVRNEGLTLPPNNLRIAVGNNDYGSSAPIYNKYFNSDFNALASFVNLLIPFVPLGLLKPDLIILCDNNPKYYNKRISTVWHELSHGSHLQAMINNKGIMWASNYWTKVVTQEGLNGVNKGDIYGKKGDNNWEYIALAEGWANYREWKMCKTYLKYNSITEIKGPTLDPYYDTDPADMTEHINYRYGGLLKNLNIYISDKIFEKAISSNTSIKGLKQQLLELYPQKSVIINKKFNDYEKLQ